jgi:hypothetical protein
MAGKYLCLACGYPGLDEPPWNGLSGSDQICPCCGLHFGYDDHVAGREDLRPTFYHGWRLKWHTDGMAWWSSVPPPDGWDPKAQFETIAARSAGDIRKH